MILVFLIPLRSRGCLLRRCCLLRPLYLQSGDGNEPDPGNAVASSLPGCRISRECIEQVAIVCDLLAIRIRHRRQFAWQGCHARGSRGPGDDERGPCARTPGATHGGRRRIRRAIVKRHPLSSVENSLRLAAHRDRGRLEHAARTAGGGSGATAPATTCRGRILSGGGS